MKTTTATTVTSTFDGETAECAFDSEGTAHLMGILSNLYRDAPRAVLREYAVNAWDAHIEAGNPAPIEVTLPTMWEPTLTVTDHGLGLSKDEIISVYSRYGKSTKRDTNDQVGAFGVGAKSAFTIGTQFTVTATKAARRTTAVFALNGQGIGTVTILSDTETDEPNGVTIKVAVDDVDAMRRAADTLFATWEPGTVLLDGERPANYFHDLLRVTDTVYAGTKTSDRGLRMVMGGIAYPATEAMLRTARQDITDPEVHTVFNRLLDSRMLICVKVDLGAVDITPSREDLRDTQRTMAMLRKAVQEYVGNVKAAVNRESDRAPTAMHASVRLGSLSGFLPEGALRRGELQWHGQTLSSQVRADWPSIELRNDKGGQRSFLDTSYTFHLGQPISHILVVTNVVNDRDRNTVRRYATRYMTAHHGVTQLLLVPNSEGETGWVRYGGDSPLATISKDEFLDAAKTLPAKATGRKHVAYTVTYNGKHLEMTAPEIQDLGQQVVAMPWPFMYQDLLRSAVTSSDVQITLQGGQTMNALKRRIPEAVEATELVHTRATTLLCGMSETERLALTYKTDDEMEVLASVATEVTSSRVQDMIAAYQAARAAFQTISTDRLRSLRDAHGYLGKRLVVGEQWQLDTDYPLLRSALWGATERARHTHEQRHQCLAHAVLYVNAVDAAENDPHQTTEPQSPALACP